MTVCIHTRGYVRVSATFVRSQHLRAPRSRSCSQGYPPPVAIAGLHYRTRHTVAASAESHAASSGRDYSAWGALREEMVSVLADLDATSTVLRIESIVTIYTILLGCEGKVRAEACSNIVR